MATRHESHLGALIEQQKRLNGLSDAQMVARAKARGEKLGKSNIGRVAGGDNPSLSRSTIFGLAAGLGVTPATVARAALADMGIILTEPEADSETAIRTDPTLSENGRGMLLALLQQIKASDAVRYLPDGRPDPSYVSGTPTSEDRLSSILERDDLTADG
ncbi:hypothetical protein LTT66_17960 [Nocardia gipuzkoensis]|uniref:hypothetical protein n=1 Tax=Nocardia gipuzkoensis TaxID=2749991 RepID=UPI001E494F0C|nr:hypothetical protein [Nocardia gipuzkoensis]UGT71857.1 hypothetical protein LTT66_17960 [Nocardia gipuzkoensis]